MTSAQLRQSFLDFFASKQHTVVPSASLMPTAPNLLFTNAGMNPFVPYFLGEQQPPYPRAVDTQKCIRAGGKHNDLEDVGFDTYHHTLFEMLGNWSFGDYFKAEAIEWAWELLTQVWCLPKARLYATVYQPGEGDPADFDHEAHGYWKAIFEREGLDPEVHIRSGNKKDNFWMMGDTGPCGPCSEVHIDLTPEGDTQGRLVNADSPWCIEIWNLVFIQFAADGQGNFTPLAHKHVDTGMGFERVAGMMATTENFTDYTKPPSNYNSDLFTDLFDVISELSGKRYGYTMLDPEQPRESLSSELMNDVIFRVLADHARALCFSIADGILPGNEGRNYVLRRILRRAVLFGKRLDLPGGFFTKLVDPVVTKYGDVFPELNDKQHIVRKVIANEEKAFERTLDRGLELLNKLDGNISGEDAFTLYDTYGFPLDLTQLIAREHGLSVDTDGFNQCMAQQRKRGRETRFVREIKVAETPTGDQQATEFVGHERQQLTGFATHISDVISADGATYLTTQATPFYAEMGGQVGDTGQLESESFCIQITDTIKDAAGRYLHRLEKPCDLKVGEAIRLSVDTQRRSDIERHHSATHLINHALREILGDHVQQAGSYNGPNRLRFDFNHYEPVSTEQLQQIENMVNRRVLENGYVNIFEIPYADKPDDIVAVFGEKYGERVRVVDIGGYSKELCGGTHVGCAAEIGLVKIVSESSISAGVRRIEAVAGQVANELAQANFNQLNQLAAQLKCKPDELPERLAKLSEQTRAMEKEVRQLRQQQASAQAQSLLSEARERDGIRLLAAEVSVAEAGDLKDMANTLSQKLGPSVVVLGARFGEKVNVCAQCSQDAMKAGYKAGDIIRELTANLGGRGGGKPAFAMGGGTEPDKLQAALEAVFA